MAARRDFRGKVVVITGAAGGMGVAFARRFADAGAHLALLDVNAESVATVAQQLTSAGKRCLGIACDVTNEEDCRRDIAAVIEHYGGIDVLMNNAGITQRSLLADTATHVYRKVMEVNFFGSLYCTKAALPSLLERCGMIIVTSSIAGIAPLYERSGYAASKHALHGLFASLRAELSGSGVDVMFVCPGFTATGIGAAALDGSGRPAQHAQSTVGKMATPESVADAVYAGATRGKRLLVLTAVGKTTALLNKFFPALYERVMTRSIRRELRRQGG